MATSPSPSSHDSDCRALSTLPAGARGRLCGHATTFSASARLQELGFVPGTPVHMVRRGPLGGPVELELRGYRLVVRRADLAGLCARLEPAA